MKADSFNDGRSMDHMEAIELPDYFRLEHTGHILIHTLYILCTHRYRHAIIHIICSPLPFWNKLKKKIQYRRKQPNFMNASNTYA